MSETPKLLLFVEPKFPLGQLGITQGAKAVLLHDDVQTALNRHAAGDWGDLDEHDTAVNEHALKDGGRLFSVYESSTGYRFYVITEADRSYTTMMLPEEY